jgi:nitrogen-specific signal transduction histidine kinase
VEGVARPRIVFRIYPGEIGAGRPAVVIEVRDNGPGISPELREKVFSPFCTTKSRGVGLGLPIVRRTMIDHGGLVFIDSGETGTAVRLVLPVWENRNGAGS